MRRAALDCTEAITTGARRRERAFRIRFSNSLLLAPSFRDGPKDQTADAQLRIGESRDSGFTLRVPRNDGRGSPRAVAARHDLLVQLLVDDVDGAIDVGIRLAELMRDQLHQKIDPLDKRRAGCDSARRR